MQTNTKDWIQYGTAVAMIASAIILTFVSFFSLSLIESSVLWYVAQALTYSGGIFGVTVYIRSKMGEAMTNARRRIREEVSDQLDRRLND